MSKGKNSRLISTLLPTVKKLSQKQELDQIPETRKRVLLKLAKFIEYKVKSGQQARLNFICTHNSRRSHIAQIWAQTASHYYDIPGVICFSGGTEATAFNERAVDAMREAGFLIDAITREANPVYEVRYAEETRPIRAFSKRYDDSLNPTSDFAAIMTCSHADENCPLVPGSTVRIALTYDDPKDFDGAPQETKMYAQRVRQIGREILFAFSQVER